MRVMHALTRKFDRPMRAPTHPPPMPAQPRRKRKRRNRSLLLSFLGYSFAAGVAAFIVGSAVVAYVFYDASRDLPSYESLASYEPPVMTRIHAHNGALIAEYAKERRIFVPINTVPKLVTSAFLSAEDGRFYEHGGLDFQGIARAVFKMVQAKVEGVNRRPEGASTITQQVAKNFLLTNQRTLDRKIKEAILAIRIERAYTKDKILELYLNEIYLGIGSYGVAAAALNYFSKELKDLTIEEVAYLAALPKAPNNYHPFRHTKRATTRRDWVMSQMYKNGYITNAQYEEARKKPLKVNFRTSGAHIFAAEYFAEEVRRSLLAEYGEEKLYGGGLSVRTTLDPRLQGLAKKALMDGLVAFDRRKYYRGPVSTIDIKGDWGVGLGKVDTPKDIFPWRLGVVLDIDPKKAIVGLKPGKTQAGKIVKGREAIELKFSEVKWARHKGKKPPKSVSDVLSVGDVIYVAPKDSTKLDGVWTLMQIPEVSGGLVAMDPHTGRVLALAGGFSFDMSQFDRAVQAKRQPGSSFKPIVYAAALDNGYKPTSIILDAPIEIEQGPGKEVWRPENYKKNSSYGPTTLRIGIEKSRNQMTVRLAQDMGMPLITEYSRRFGVYDDLLPVLSMSLGAGETTLLRMVTAYSVFANGGKRVRATLIDRIQDRWGKAIWQHDRRTCSQCVVADWQGDIAEPALSDDRRQIIDPHTAFQITSMLEGVVQRGTARSLKKLNMPLAGKTGTTNEEKDAWFLGFSPDLVVGVYVGFDTPKPMGKGQTGGKVAAPIFGDFMKMAQAGKPVTPFRVPPGIRLVDVNARTGLRASPGDPDTTQEAFKPNEYPDDAYSVIGFSETVGVDGQPSSDGNWQTEPTQRRPSSFGAGRGGLW